MEEEVPQPRARICASTTVRLHQRSLRCNKDRSIGQHASKKVGEGRPALSVLASPSERFRWIVQRHP
eukprot:6508091-Pyramimonas_sp.AAC.1